MNNIRCFECRKHDHIIVKCFQKQNYINKDAMKAKVTLSDSTNSDDDYDTNFMTFVTSSSVVDLLTIFMR